MFRKKQTQIKSRRQGHREENENDRNEDHDAIVAQRVLEGQSPSEEFMTAYNATKPSSQRRLEEGNDDFNDNEGSYTPYKSYNENSTTSCIINKNGKEETLFGDGDPEEEADKDEDNVYIVKQRHGYSSVIFSVAQIAVLGTMMYECGIAPLQLNPMIGPYPDGLSYWGGKNAYMITKDDEWWRLITPIFLHAGILHLFGNIAVQLDAGAFFEREWGSPTWLAIYLLSAVGSSLLSCVAMPNMVSVGSSGAVCGLFGGKLAEIFCRACESDKTPQGRVGHEVRKEQLGAVMCSVIVVGLFSFVPYVDWGAHLGGLLGGLCIGMVLFPFKIKTRGYRYFWFIIGITMTMVYFSFLLDHVYTDLEIADELADVCEYYKQMSEGYECNCQLDNNNG